MKNNKIIVAVVTLAVILTVAASLTACRTEEYVVENHDWQFKFAQSSETGEVIFCSEEFAEGFPDAKIMEMTAKAENGKLIATDGENEMIFTYTVEKAVPGESTIYDIADENGIKGNASVGKTTYADGSAEYTLIISFEGRAFYFKAPVE